MRATFHQHEHARGYEPATVPMEAEAQAGNADLASEMEVGRLQEQINGMNAKAQQIEHEIAQMMAETGGANGHSLGKNLAFARQTG